MKSYRIHKIEILPVQITTAIALGVIGAAIVAAICGAPITKRSVETAPDAQLVEIRDNFAGQIKKYVCDDETCEEASLGLSYLLGMKEELSKETSENLKAIGLTHIVVASGTHLSILAGATKKIFGKVSRFFGTLMAGIFIILFASMIGWTASISRAAIVSGLTLAAGYYGRKFQPWRIVVIAMAITLAINPANLLNLGWELSFAAYAGILLVAPMLSKWLYGEHEVPKLAGVLIASLAATALCLPLQLYFFGSFSLLSLAANLVILPTMPAVMGLVFGVGCVGLIFPLAAPVLGWVTARALDLHLLVMGWLAQQEVFRLELKPYQPWMLCLYAWLLVPLSLRAGRALKRYGAKDLQTPRDRQF